MEDFGKLVQKSRQEKGISQQALASLPVGFAAWEQVQQVVAFEARVCHDPSPVLLLRSRWDRRYRFP